MPFHSMANSVAYLQLPSRGRMLIHSWSVMWGMPERQQALS